jgi:probable DNA repair protein
MRLACRDLPQWFAKNATIVTPTAFLAGVAHEQFARERLKQRIETWERPSIYGLDAWLVSRWSEARYSSADIPTLLSTPQELTLWHGIIEREQPHLFDVSATVRLAREAAELMSQWHIPSEGEAWSEHADARQFQHWHKLLWRKCRENGWITRSDLARLVPGWIADGTIRPKLTVFVGFDAMWSSLETLQGALGALNVRLAFDRNSLRKAKAKCCEDPASEIEFAARRLRYLFEANPNRSLALFVPELSEQYELVERTLDSVFFPSIAAKISGPSSAAVESLFRVASSGRLMDHPLVSAALLLLNLASPRIDQADAGAILRSPFVKGAAAERYQRGLADIELRKRRELDVSLEDMAWASRACPVFNACLKRAEKILVGASQARTLAEWSEWISDLLAAMGWPGETDLTAREERIIERWKEQLSTLSGLGLVSSAMTLETALTNLRRLLSVRLERGEWSSPIQVLDAAQAEGVVFDAAVAVGLSEETWPPRRRISPLIPLKLQRFRQSAADERLRATRALFESAPEVLALYHGRMAAAVEGFIAKKDVASATWDGLLPENSFPPATLQQFADGQAPPFVMRGEMRGGTGIIKAQSQCPFQAFAKYRLNARRPEDASFGFDALDRGSFVHKALEKIWQRLGSQVRLRSTLREDLRMLVKEAVAEAVPERQSGPLHQLSVATERERLEELVLDWLDVERDRSEPFIVETIEQERRFEVPGLSLKLRVDRIDRLKNGSLVLIDYKSGKQTKPKLCGDRPPEPQLLVYAASVDSPVDGIFFGQVKPREVKAVGYSRIKHFRGSATDVKKDWETYLEESRDNVESLAKEFVEGVAEVRPTGAPCEYCGMKPFCRINEQGTAQEEEE